jgi:hypothetical protein
MRFMIIVKATTDSENGVMPDEKLLAVLSQIFTKCKAALISGHSYPAKAINCL